MKMMRLRRAVLTATAAFGLFGVVLAILETLGARVFELLHKAASASGVLCAFLLIVLVALAAMCVYALVIALEGRKAANARMITLEGTKDDVVLIKQETLDSIVKSVIGQPDGVTDIKITTQYRDMALDIQVELTVDMNTNIASVTRDMQVNIREQLEKVNGITLSGVSVIISALNVPENTEGMVMPWNENKEAETEEAKEAEEAVFEEETAEESAEETTETEEEPEEAEVPSEEAIVNEEPQAEDAE